MSAKIRVQNFPSLNIKELTYLSADVAAGLSTFTPENIQGLSENDFIFIDQPGQEQVEKRQITDITTGVVTVAALSNPHNKGAQVMAVVGDQVKLYRASNVDGSIPADGSFSAVGSAVDLDSDNVETEITDSSGGTGYWYKYVYYNSNTAQEVSNLADVDAVRGGGFGDYTTLSEIRFEAGMQSNKYVTDVYIAECRLAAQAEIDAALKFRYTVPFDPVPELVSYIAKVLAAGMVLVREYGPQAEGTSKEGKNKLDEARDLLKKIQDGVIDLVDAIGNPISATNRVTGWPNAETEDAEPEDGGARRSFRISDRY